MLMYASVCKYSISLSSLLLHKIMFCPLVCILSMGVIQSGLTYYENLLGEVLCHLSTCKPYQTFVYGLCYFLLVFCTIYVLYPILILQQQKFSISNFQIKFETTMFCCTVSVVLHVIILKKRLCKSNMNLKMKPFF